jgi:hypothetical protein
MRIRLTICALLIALAGCGGTPSGSDGGDAGGCAADLAGTQRQICGMPDASFSAAQCQCVGDP